jgi:Spy/CpxP family protein refolding chaperone
MKQHLVRFAAVTALAAGMAVAQAPDAGTPPAAKRVPFMHPLFGRQQMMQALNLTIAQRQQAHTIFGDSRQRRDRSGRRCARTGRRFTPL